VSLRAFHILFIALSVALSATVAAWGVQRYLADSDSGALALAGTFFVAGLALVVYGSRYFQKLKELQ
jgi:hypothetical protein